MGALGWSVLFLCFAFCCFGNKLAIPDAIINDVKKQVAADAGERNLMASWKRAFLRRGDRMLDVVSETTKSFMALMASASQTSVEENVQELLDLRATSTDPDDADHTLHFIAFVEIDRGRYGISQFIQDTALACRFFSSSTFQRQCCDAYPKLHQAAMKLVFYELPDRGIQYRYPSIETDDRVNLNRGMVLVRAALPLFLTPGATFNTTLVRLFQGELKAVLKDYMAHLVVHKYGVSSRIFMDQFSIANAVAKCREARQAARSNIERCTSNHLVANYLGLLLTRVILGESLTDSVNEMSSLIEYGIFANQGKLFPSDLYRRFEQKGITYSLLMLRLWVISAEILLVNGQTNLYGVHNEKLMSALNNMAYVCNSPSVSAFSSRAPQFVLDGNTREFEKYVKKSSLSDPAASVWARPYGFFALPYRRFCSKSSWRTKYPHLCAVGDGVSNTIPIAGTTYDDGNLNFALDSVYMGPTQLLYLYDKRLR